MSRWTATQSSEAGGFFRIEMQPFGMRKVAYAAPPGSLPEVADSGEYRGWRDVTFFRGVPTELQSYSFGDPFSDAVASIRFPQITGHDDLTSGEVGSWLRDHSLVRISWVTTEPWVSGPKIIDPLSQQPTLQEDMATVIWEGFVISFEIEATQGSSSLSVQCQGALYQLDRYIQKPFYPPVPWAMEQIIRQKVFNTPTDEHRPHLALDYMTIDWPAGWTKTLTRAEAAKVVPYRQMGGTKVGRRITGLSTRQTGSFERSLTGFVQDLLAVMFTPDDAGVTPGNQWTLRKAPSTGNRRPRPVLQVRDRFRTPDYEVWMGTPGVEIRLSRDGTQQVTAIYGEGINTDGTTWRNAIVRTPTNALAYTDWQPLAATKESWPLNSNHVSGFVSETYNKYGSGFNQEQAIKTAEKQLIRDSDPGYSGDITLRIDLDLAKPRWLMKAGEVIKIKGLGGLMEGINFHIAEVNVDVMGGSVTCRIDSKFRDLLTLEEVMARTRDPLTPTKLLQINRRTILLEDNLLPWDYTQGSGYIPFESFKRFRGMNSTEASFPWDSYVRNHPPRNNKAAYIFCKGSSTKRSKRWTVRRVRVAEKATIRRIEMAAYDRNGNPLAVPFHVSLYSTQKPIFPRDADGPSPFLPNAFQETDENGNPWTAPNMLGPDKSMIIGWGAEDTPVGYWPGSKLTNRPVTGRFVEEGTFTMDLSAPIDKHKPGNRRATDGFCWIAVYCEYDAFFIGRMYRQEPGF